MSSESVPLAVASATDDVNYSKPIGVKIEEAQIRGFTLMFDDPSLEMRWRSAHLNRYINMTTRYLFVAACFQGLFLWGDMLEHQNRNQSQSIVQIASIRFILGLFALVGCFLIRTGLYVPSQLTLWWMNIVYGIPTLALFYFNRQIVSHWDSLFLIYGLCFFMLPKISPLNFIFGLSGGTTISFLFIYISAYRLSFQQWLLSNAFLIVLMVLFSYLSYSSEKISRERWLLKEFLKLEHINFRIMSSSFQDDFSRAVNDEQPFPLDVHYMYSSSMPPPLQSSESYAQGSNSPRSSGHSNIGNDTNNNSTNNLKNERLVATAYENKNNSNNHVLHYASQTLKRMLVNRFNRMQRHKSQDKLELCNNDNYENIDNSCSRNITDNNHKPHSSSSFPHSTSSTYLPTNNSSYTSNNNNNIHKSKRMQLFYKGLSAWALCYGMGYAFDIEEANKSAAFALMMHSMGFSAFLMVFTGQIRWLALNAVIGLAIMWIFNQTGMESKWAVFSAHSVGYIILFIVVIVMILVFGGIVLVWSHLIDFLKEVLIRYPDMKKNIGEDKVLEQVLIHYISNIPKSDLFSSSSSSSSLSPARGDITSIKDSCKGHLSSTMSNTTSGAVSTPTATATKYLLLSKEPTVSSSSSSSSSSSTSIHSINNNNNRAYQRKGNNNNSVNSTTTTTNKATTLSTTAATKHTTASQKKSTIQSQSQLHDNEGIIITELTLVEPRRPNCCFFCLKPSPVLAIPACCGWLPLEQRAEQISSARGNNYSDDNNDNINNAAANKKNVAGASGSNSASGGGIAMCTPYTEMIRIRDEAILTAETATSQFDTLQKRITVLEYEKNEKSHQIITLNTRLYEMEKKLHSVRTSLEQKLEDEKRGKEVAVQNVISQYNTRLSELKRLHKNLTVSADATVSKNSNNTKISSSLNSLSSVSVSTTFTNTVLTNPKHQNTSATTSSVSSSSVHQSTLQSTVINNNTNRQNRSNTIPKPHNNTATTTNTIATNNSHNYSNDNSNFITSPSATNEVTRHISSPRNTNSTNNNNHNDVHKTTAMVNTTSKLLRPQAAPAVSTQTSIQQSYGSPSLTKSMLNASSSSLIPSSATTFNTESDTARDNNNRNNSTADMNVFNFDSHSHTRNNSDNNKDTSSNHNYVDIIRTIHAENNTNNNIGVYNNNDHTANATNYHDEDGDDGVLDEIHRLLNTEFDNPLLLYDSSPLSVNNQYHNQQPHQEEQSALNSTSDSFYDNQNSDDVISSNSIINYHTTNNYHSNQYRSSSAPPGYHEHEQFNSNQHENQSLLNDD